MKKAWAENARTKISRIEDRAKTLKEVGDVMYGKGYVHGMDPVEWAGLELDKIRARRPSAERFMKYIDKHWRKKIGMWCIANRNIPHAGQNTNAAIESFHANLKRILYLEKQRFMGRRMDWTADDMQRVVTAHYWYFRALKEYGFIRNRKQEILICSAILAAQEIPDDYVHFNTEGEDIALVVSINNYPQVWTVYGPDSEWAQCDCFLGEQSTMCKHVMKCFLMKHPYIEPGLILREAGTRHGVERTIPLSQCFESMPREEDDSEDSSWTSDSNCASSVVLPSDGTAKNPIILGNEETKKEFPIQFQGPVTQDSPEVVFKELLCTAKTHSEIHLHLVADLKHIRGKYRKMIAHGVVRPDLNDTPRSFPLREGDWSLKRKPGRLETSKARKRCKT